MDKDYQYYPPWWRNPSYNIPDECEHNPLGFSAMYKAEVEENEKKAMRVHDGL